MHSAWPLMSSAMAIHAVHVMQRRIVIIMLHRLSCTIHDSHCKLTLQARAICIHAADYFGSSNIINTVQCIHDFRLRRQMILLGI